MESSLIFMVRGYNAPGLWCEAESKAQTVAQALWEYFQFMNTPTRTLTIEDFNPNGRFRRISDASLIRLKGCWLKQAGFHCGAQVTVSNPSSGIIELRVCSPVHIVGSYFTALHQPDVVLK